MDFVRFKSDDQILAYLQFAMPRMGMIKPETLQDAVDNAARFEGENIAHHAKKTQYRDSIKAIAFAVKVKWTLRGFLTDRYSICFFSLDGTRYLFREITGQDFPARFSPLFDQIKE